MTTLADVGLGNISERRELHATGWRDCTQAAAMRGCADHGIVFPLADLDLEREALERSDDYPDEAGATMDAIVTAMDRRYGYSGDPVTDLRTALRTPGCTLLIQGTAGNLPDHQKRWDDYMGGHAIAYRVLSPTGGTFLDPRAPMGFAGDAVTPAQMEAFAWGASTTRAFRWKPGLLAGQGGEMIRVDPQVAKAALRIARVIAPTPLLRSPGGERVADAKVGYKYQLIGSDSGYRAVVVPTALVWDDGVEALAVLWLSAKAITVDPAPAGDAAGVWAKWKDWLGKAPTE